MSDLGVLVLCIILQDAKRVYPEIPLRVDVDFRNKLYGFTHDSRNLGPDLTQGSRAHECIDVVSGEPRVFCLTLPIAQREVRRLGV